MVSQERRLKVGRLLRKTESSGRRKNRVKSVVRGTADRPRLSVRVSNRHISAQIIDDQKSKTIVGISSASNTKLKGNLTQKAEEIGLQIAKLAKAKKVKRVSFDRGSSLYHGRVKALADAARKEGLEF